MHTITNPAAADDSSVSSCVSEARARRAAQREGYRLRKSRRAVGGIDNLGGFMIIDPSTNFAVAGFRYDMSAEEVIAWCSETA